MKSSLGAQLLLQLLLLVLLFSSRAIAVSKFIIPSLPGYPGGNLPFKLETGYIGVGELDEVQLFYYFIESERDPRRDPLMLWLTGGPGCSGFSGLVFEIGPLSFNLTDYYGDKPTFQLNPYSWTKVANIIFIDAPVGTGFSYANTSAAYNNITDTVASSHLYEFLNKWLIDHPKFIKNHLYIAGDSYGGKMTPILVSKILLENEHGAQVHMNLQGYSIGNPVTYVDMDENSRVEYAFRVSLLSKNLYESTKRSCGGNYVKVESNNTECIANLRAVGDCINSLFIGNILEPSCAYASHKSNLYAKSLDPVISANMHSRILKTEPKQQQYYSRHEFQKPSHHLHFGQLSSPDWWCRSDNYLASYVWTNDEIVRDALHVRKGTVNVWARCNNSLSYTSNIESVVDYHHNMTNKLIRALVYSGDQDMGIPYLGTMKWVKSLGVPVSDNWRPWFVQGQVAGYSTKYSNVNYHLTYATVKGGGHTAPEYKPEQCFSMISRWLDHYPL